MLTKRQMQAIKTKNQLIICAMQLFNENNYEKVTIKDICYKASVSIGAFYHYFDSKEDIINESFKNFDDQLEQNNLTQEFTTAREAICYLMDHYFKSTSNTGYGVVNTIYRLEMANNVKYIIDKKRAFHCKIKELVELGLEEGEFKSELQPEGICDWIFRTARGTVFDWCLHEGQYDLVVRGNEDILLIVHALLV